ncbi:hypothetical protein Cni_G23324 [Canna indica]|uniref:Uncharacterized protein n=1 Tax=Canna indica TaxID=4628 RepID=A0AAQ3KTL1_9LILI|nr:hypothetical protein Cni_G23324 [Canna indica]
MELLQEQEGEEAAAAADVDDRLGSVIRSLEAEISAAAAATDGDDMMLDSVHRHEDCEDCRLDDILAGVDSRQGCSAGSSSSSTTAYLVEEPFGWVESPCSDMADWYVDECIDEMMATGYGELRGQGYLHCSGESSAEEQFCSLWEL